ncbi:Peptidase S8 propeptide/proteinase inhibitor I9 [Arabidopsis suecica]|uniref:Peptidase S8 propeptide/proteinase inhibitor I9 n=1 Tax=Arabidopsis suecica TaxID=45249 RepID=A0A8T2ANB5_ARASU|nr:Peptidase S8 propeptide/proteinase inhibitor I9 [Arabidopsis suecica]
MISQILLIFLAFSVSVVCSSRMLGPSPDNPLMKVYLVHVDFELYHGDCKQYQQLLKKVVHGRSPKDALVYCYKEVVSGFAAKLTDEEAKKLIGEKGIYGVDEDEVYSMNVEPYSHRLAKDINN